jgi:hypothetical protein
MKKLLVKKNDNKRYFHYYYSSLKKVPYISINITHKLLRRFPKG